MIRYISHDKGILESVVKREIKETIDYLSDKGVINFDLTDRPFVNVISLDARIGNDLTLEARFYMDIKKLKSLCIRKDNDESYEKSFKTFEEFKEFYDRFLELEEEMRKLLAVKY